MEKREPRKYQREDKEYHRIMVNLPVEIAKKVREGANRTNMSISYFCRILLEEALQRWETNQGGSSS
jgi:hypothetical protein